MDIIGIIKSRRSIRKFSGRKVADSIIKKIIFSGTWAPSACDVQGWRFIIIRKDKTKQQLASMGAASFIKDAPVGILVIYDNRTDNIEYMDHIQSASAAIQNMLLYAHHMGLGSCWICHLPPKKQIRRLLNIPHNYDPVAYIALGYYDSPPKPRARKNAESKIISYGLYNFKESVPSLINPRLSAKRALRKAYYMLPFRKYIKPAIDNLFERRFE